MSATSPARLSLARDLHPDRFADRATAVTIGNFDGVHRGHQAMLQVVCEAAALRGLTPAVVTFAPAPGAYFSRLAGKTPPTKLQRLRDKLACIWAIGISHIQLLRFNAAMAAMLPDEFCEQVLKLGLNAKWVIVGDDFRYGKARAGDIKTLHAWCAANSIECYVMPVVSAKDVRFSSTLVRELLREGDVVTAAAMLGRPYRISGKVAHGEKLGRSIGFPTINLPLWSPLPISGIFAVRVYGIAAAGGLPVMGAASVGVRPTVTTNGAPLLEVFLLDFTGDLYGQRIVVEFVAHVRAEEKFDSLEIMTAQMHRDIDAVRGALVR